MKGHDDDADDKNKTVTDTDHVDDETSDQVTDADHVDDETSDQ